MPYCIHCGAPLEDGQQCTCPGAQASAPQPDSFPHTEPIPQADPAPQPDPVPQPDPAPSAEFTSTPGPAAQPQPGPAAPAAPSPVMVTLKNLLPFLKAYWRSPAQATASAAAQNDLLLAGLLTIIQAISAILAAVAVLMKINRAISYAFSFFGSGAHISGGYGVLYGLLATILGVGLMTVMIFLLSKLMNGNASFKTAFISCGVNTIPVTILLLLAFLLGLLSLPLGVGLLVMVLPIFVVPGAVVARQLCPQPDSGKFWALYSAGVILVLAISWLVLSAIVF